MFSGTPIDPERRVLVVAPTSRDAAVTSNLLAKAGLSCVVCGDLKILCGKLDEGAAALMLTEKAFTADGIEVLLATLKNQPAWSDMPVVVMMRGGTDSPIANRVLQSIGNVVLLERPAPMRSVASAVQAAVRGRERQYLLRQHLQNIRTAEMMAKALQEQLELAITASELGTFHCPFPLGKILWNDRCKAHFWLAPNEEIDFDLFYSILHPEDRERTREAIAACVEQGKVYDIEYRTVSPSGDIRWIRATGRTYFTTDTKPIRFDGTTQDITARKAAEEKLRESQERFRAMANSIPQLAWMADADGSLFWYNQRWHDYCGSTDEQMKGWGWQTVHDPDELPRVVASWKAALASGEPWEDTFPLRRHDGTYRWHLSRARPFRDPKNNVVLWFGTNTDITEERNRAAERDRLLTIAQANRDEAERASRTKDEFLATLSHELRTPLNAILGWSQLIRRDGSDPETLEEGLAIIERNARVQVQLIEDLLDMSRIISGKIRLEVQTVDAGSFIDAAIETVKPAADAKEIRIHKMIDAQAGDVSGDPNRLQQVVWNLLSNAIKFTPKGGRIEVLLQRVNSQLELSVSDTGMGIAPDFLPYVFERFRQADASTTRAYGGLGLGLAIVKHLVELHGGTIRASSRGVGMGSTFSVLLPITIVHRDNGEEKRIHPHALRNDRIDCDAASLMGLKILVVDDEKDARNLIKRVLEDCEAQVITAGSAAEALPLIEAEKPDLLISDIGMPTVDGYEFLRQVRALGASRGGKLPAVALTAFARSEDRTRALMAGYLVHVSKPVEPQELLATVATVAGRTGGSVDAQVKG